jgi:hypothetical protein
MTTVRDLIQTSPQGTEALLDELAETKAPQERESRLAALRQAVETQLRLEETHLLPALEGHDETKGLVAGLRDANRRTRDLLAEAQDAPEDNEAFAARLGKLRQAFHRQIRDDRSELLPAVVKALSGAELSAIAGEIEDHKARMQSPRKGTETPRSDAGRGRTTGKVASPGADAGGAKVRVGRERVAPGGGPAANAPRLASLRSRVEPSSPDEERPDEATARASTEGGSGAEALERRAAPSAGVDRPAVQDTASIGGALTALAGEQADHAMRTAAAIGRSKTLAEMAAHQTDFVGGSIRRMMRANDAFLALLQGGMAGTSASPPRR